MSEQMLHLIRSRRVVRNLADQPVARAQLEQILEAGRWAPCGGNQRLHRFVAVQDPLTLRLLRMVSPGMFQRPPAVILICLDLERLAFYKVPASDPVRYVDVGTAMENMMLAAHALGLGAGPVTSFSKEGVRVVLNLPSNLVPELFVCVGHPVRGPEAKVRPKRTISWQDLTDWERFNDSS